MDPYLYFNPHAWINKQLTCDNHACGIEYVEYAEIQNDDCLQI